MIEKMREIADAEKIAIDDEALAAIAYRADGGLRDALTMLEQLAAFSGERDGYAHRRSTSPSARPGASSRDRLIDAILAGDAAARSARSRSGQRRRRRSHRADPRAASPAFATCWWHASIPGCSPATSPPRMRSAPSERAAGFSQAMLVRALRTFSEALSLGRGRKCPPRVGDGAAALHPGRRGSHARRARVARGRDRGAPGAGRPRRPRAESQAASAACARCRHRAGCRLEPPQARQRCRQPMAAARAVFAAERCEPRGRASARRSRANANRCGHRFRAPAVESLESNAIVLNLPDAWRPRRCANTRRSSKPPSPTFSACRCALRCGSTRSTYASPRSGAAPTNADGRPTRSSIMPTNGYDKQDESSAVDGPSQEDAGRDGQGSRRAGEHDRERQRRRRSGDGRRDLRSAREAREDRQRGRRSRRRRDARRSRDGRDQRRAAQRRTKRRRSGWPR